MWFNLFGSDTKQEINNDNSDNSKSTSCFGWLLPPYSDTDYFSKEFKEIMLGIASNLITLPVAITLACVEHYLRSTLSTPWANSRATEIDYYAILDLCVISPIIEELYFRWSVKNDIKYSIEGTGLVSSATANTCSIVCSSLLFSVAHNYGSKTTRFVDGMIYGLLADKTNAGLPAAIASHMTHNAIIAGLEIGLRRA